MTMAISITRKHKRLAITAVQKQTNQAEEMLRTRASYCGNQSNHMSLVEMIIILE